MDNSAVVEFDLAINVARQALYRIGAWSLHDPQAGTWDRLSEFRNDALPLDATALIRGLPEAVPKELGLGERPLIDLDLGPVFDRLPFSRAGLNAAFERTFGLLVSAACPPYETEYIDSKSTFQRSNTLADVSGFYRAFGLTPSREHPERHDHIALELEFMAHLLGMERQAAESDANRRKEYLEVCRAAQSRFLSEHLAWWIPTFAKLLKHQDPGGFYEAVGSFLAAWIPAERALLNVDVQSRPASPSMEARPENCDGCQLAT